MRPAVEIREVREGDAQELVERMRAQDVAECRAVGHDDLLEAVRQSIRLSALCWTAEVDGRLACIFGLAPCGTVLTPRGAPWLLGTDEVPRNRRALVRLTAPYIARMLALCPHLVNFVHARNTVAMQWLSRVGFTLHEAVAVPPHGELFHRFEMRA